MSSLIQILGNYSYHYDAVAGTITLSADKVENTRTTTSGTVRLELWLTATPWDQTGSNSGYEVTVDRQNGTTDGTLAPNYYYSNVSVTVPLEAVPQPGTYFVTLVAAEYDGTQLGTDDGYVTDSAYMFTNLW